MKSMLTFWRFSLVPVIALLAGAVPPATTPAHALSIHAECQVPFPATIPDKDMKALQKVLAIEKIEFDGGWLEKSIRQQLDAHRAEIEKADAAYFTQIDKHLVLLTEEAKKALADTDAARKNALDAGLGKSLNELKSLVEKDKAVMVITGTFQFTPGALDPFNPGWGDKQDGHIDSSHPGVANVVPLDQTIALTPAGIPIAVPVSMKAHFDFSTDYEAQLPNIGDRNMPESPTGCDPFLKIKGSVELTSENGALGRNGQITRVGATYNIDLPRVRGTIKATLPEPAKAP